VREASSRTRPSGVGSLPASPTNIRWLGGLVRWKGLW
jgi:hypothetical protein